MYLITPNGSSLLSVPITCGYAYNLLAQKRLGFPVVEFSLDIVTWQIMAFILFFNQFFYLDEILQFRMEILQIILKKQLILY